MGTGLTSFHSTSEVVVFLTLSFSRYGPTNNECLCGVRALAWSECVKEMCYSKRHVPTHKLKNTLSADSFLPLLLFLCCRTRARTIPFLLKIPDTLLSTFLYFIFLSFVNLSLINVFFFLFSFFFHRQENVMLVFSFSVCCAVLFCLVHFFGSLTILYHLNHCFFY